MTSMSGMIKMTVLILTLGLFFCVESLEQKTARALAKNCPTKPDDGYFYYFAYGSNMLAERMLINCKSAKFVSTAVLVNYRLDFNMSLPRWDGAVSTIVEDNNSTVEGVVWQISLAESSKLNEQEGVDLGWYYHKDMDVNLKCKNTVSARVFICSYPPIENVPPEDLPLERQPSRTYQMVIVLGALRNNLSARYLNNLLRFKNNGRLAPREIREELGYPFHDKSLP